MKKLSMLRCVTRLSMIVIGFIVPGLAGAAQPQSKPIPPVIRHMEQSGGQLTESYPATKDLTAWVVEKDGRRQLFYTTPGQALVAGRVFGDNGEDLSALDRLRIGVGQPGGEYSTAWKALSGVRYGTPHAQPVTNPSRVIYIIFDPMCPHCRALWRSARATNFPVGAEVRWVPVAKLRTESAILAQVMLDAKDAAGRDQSMVGIASNLFKVRPEVQREIDANGAIFDGLGVSNVPVMLYRDFGGRARAIVGPEIDAVLLAASQGR